MVLLPSQSDKKYGKIFLWGSFLQNSILLTSPPRISLHFHIVINRCVLDIIDHDPLITSDCNFNILNIYPKVIFQIVKDDQSEMKRLLVVENTGKNDIKQ